MQILSAAESVFPEGGVTSHTTIENRNTVEWNEEYEILEPKIRARKQEGYAIPRTLNLPVVVIVVNSSIW